MWRHQGGSIRQVVENKNLKYKRAFKSGDVNLRTIKENAKDIGLDEIMR